MAHRTLRGALIVGFVLPILLSGGAARADCGYPPVLTAITNGNINNTVTNDGTCGNDLDRNGNRVGTGNVTTTRTNNGTVDGNISSGGINGVDTGNITNTITNNGTVDGSIAMGSNSIFVKGNLTNTIVINGNVGGGVSFSVNAVTGVGNVTDTLILKSGSVGGEIYGDVAIAYHGTHTRILVFNQTINSEAEWDRLKALLPTLLPDFGSVTINGIPYSYESFDQLIDDLILQLPVTWFDPGDGRVDPRPGDHLAAYCNLDKGTIGAILIGPDSQDKVLTTFDYSKVKAAGKNGLSVNLGQLGIVSLMVDSQNNFWMAWNGGVYHATGQGDFAKGFSCAFS